MDTSVLALPLPPERRVHYGLPTSACLYFRVLTYLKKFDPCVLGEGGERGVLQELMNVNTLSAIKICNLPSPKRYDEYPGLFLMYLAPRPPLPWGAEGVGFLLCPPRWGVYQWAYCLLLAMPKSLEFQTIGSDEKYTLTVWQASKIKVTAHRNLQIVSPKTKPL